MEEKYMSTGKIVGFCGLTAIFFIIILMFVDYNNWYAEKYKVDFEIELATGADSALITLNIKTKNGIKEVIFPDGSTNTYNNELETKVNYKVEENGIYEFTVINNKGKKTIKKISVNTLPVEEEVIYYTVKLELENASTRESEKTVIAHESTTFTIEPNESYVFDRFECNDSSTFEEDILTITDVDRDMTCKVYYKGKDIKINYESNSGRNMMASSDFNYGDEIILKENAFVKEGYQFLGWNTDKNSHTVLYEDKAALNLGPDVDEITLYAIWKRTVTANFKLNNARSISSAKETCDIYNSETSCVVTAPSITAREGYTAMGWNTDESALTGQFLPNTNVNLFQDTTYYAITVDPNNEIQEISYQAFKILLNSDVEKVIYIGSPSCSACNSFYPVLERTANNNEITVHYLNTNTLNNSEINELKTLIPDFSDGIRTPYTFVAKNGTIVSKLIGSSSASEIENLFKTGGLL